MLSNHALQEAQNLRYQNSQSFYEGHIYIYMDFVLLMVFIFLIIIISLRYQFKKIF